MKSYFTAALGLIILALYAGQPSTAYSGQHAEEGLARILVIEEHPFDLEAALENPNGINLANTLRFFADRDTDTINTNYYEMKSIVTVIRGPVPAGTLVTFKYRQFVSGKRYDYERFTEIPEGINTEPAIIVNSYRVSRSAKVRVRAYIGDTMIAERKFKAKGKAHSFGGAWSTKAGDRKLAEP